MDCGDVRTNLHDLQRRRLPPSERDEILAHVQGCEACTRAAEAEEALDDLLAHRLPRHAAPPGLRRRLESMVASGIEPARRERRRWMQLVAPALAAGLALATGVLLLDRAAVRESSALASLTGEAVNDHLRVLASAHPVEIESGGPHQVKPWFEGRLDFAPVVPAPEGSEVRLQGGAVGYFLDRKAAVIVYAVRLHAVTLLVFRTQGLEWPASNQSLGPVPASASSARGFNVVLWRAGELGYALVSDVSLPDLVGLATNFAPTTVR